MHRGVLFVIRTVYLGGGGLSPSVCDWMSALYKNTYSINLSALAVLDTIMTQRLHCPTMKGFPFINAIRHPLSLDARPHKATLAALSLRHCHLCVCVCVCVPSYLHERKMRFMWHTCAPRGSDRKRASVRRPLPMGKRESVADSVTRHGYCFN